MANPRATVDFTEIESHYLTFLRKTSSTGAIDYLYSSSNPYPANTTTQAGQSVSMSANKTVKVGASGDALTGKLSTSAADGTCVVQVDGVMTFAYSGVPVLGRGVVCDGSGGVTVAASGSEWKERGEVLDIDSTNTIVTVLVTR